MSMYFAMFKTSNQVKYIRFQINCFFLRLDM